VQGIGRVSSPGREASDAHEPHAPVRIFPSHRGRAAMSTKPATFTAVSCRVMVSFGDQALRARQLLRGALPYEPSAGEVTFDVLAANEAARFTQLAPSGEPLWTMVRRAGTRASTVWDHHLRMVVELAHDQVSLVVVSSPGKVSLRTRSAGDQTVAEVEVEDANAGRLRQVLHFSRREELAPYGPPLLRMLYGGRACHARSGFPLARLERLGFLNSALTYVGNDDTPAARVVVEHAKVIQVSQRDFAPPRGFTVPSHPSEPPPTDPTVPQVLAERPEVRPEMFAVDREPLTAEEAFTPDCLGTTRYGSMAVVLHQDTLDHITRLINAVAGVVGTATLAGEVAIPWLDNLAAIASPSAPGKGLFCLLRDVRINPSGTRPRGAGGLGIVDQIAVRDLIAPDETGRSRLQREALAGTLLNSMRSWGILNTALIAKLFAAGGDLRDQSISISERIEIADDYEKSTYGTLRLGALPYEMDISVPGLVRGHLWSLTGAMDFTTLGGLSLITATIGPAGNIVVVLNVPVTTLTATATWQLDPLFAGASEAVALLSCLLFPFACQAAVATAVLLNFFLQTQLSVIEGSMAGVTITLDVAYQWDDQRGVVTPSVAVLSRTGSVTLTPTWRAPNAIQMFAETILASAGNVLGLWADAVAMAVAKAIEDGLRSLGLECPLGADQLGLSAASGTAESATGSRLTLYAEVRQDPDTAGHASATQVPTGDQVARVLEACHSAMRSDLTPPPQPSSPIGVYGGLGLSQNALNHYAAARWRRGDYQWETADQVVIAKLVAVVPPPAFAQTVSSIHAWSASSPRVEVAQASLESLGPPLVVFFDDLRICFEGLAPSSDSPHLPLLELSASISVPAAVTLGDQLAADFAFYLGSIQAGDQRVWESVDPNSIKGTTGPGWAPLVETVAYELLAGHDAATVVKALGAPAPAWRRPLPSGQPQRLFQWAGAGVLPPQDGYLELLGQRRVLYLLPAIRSELIEFVDGSGAPMLNTLLGTTASPVSITTMTCPQGSSLRVNFGFVIPP
jgi:hypothetical protein